MTKLIAETAWHHEGDFPFMKDLLHKICEESVADIVKMHISLDLDEYMHSDHTAYDVLKKWMFSPEQWAELIAIVQESGKELMLLLNDSTAVEFAAKFKPDFIELHSTCLNVPSLQKSVLKKMGKNSKIVVGVGGCSLQEIDAALNVFKNRQTILMFGFQNYPTKYEDVNLKKVRKIQSLYSEKSFGYADHTAWNEENNELITLLVSSNGMDFVEKHVTTLYGQERCDYSAAVSIEMFNQLATKLKLLDQLYGNGLLALNAGEQSYSQYGPMKMAALVKKDKEIGDVFSQSDFSFCRTSQATKMSQLDVIDMLGAEFTKPIKAKQVIDWMCFE